MKDIQFPVQFVFRVSTLHNDFRAIDASGKTIAYVKQKLFKFKEDIQIFYDDSQTDMQYRIKADRWIDFSAGYKFINKEGIEIGKIGRKGWASIWRAKYEIFDENPDLKYTITEENAWIKVIDSLLGEIPVLGFLTGYLFNPKYIVKKQDGTEVARLKKQPSFFGRKFEIDELIDLKGEEDDRILLGLMMMILLERRRG